MNPFRNNIPKLIWIVSFFLLTGYGFGQSGEIKIKFIGNCGMYMTDGNLNIYTDFPYKSGAYHYMEYDPAELDSIPENSLFIFTHKHADHYSKKILKKVLKAKGGKKYGPWNSAKLEELSNSIPDFSIKAFKTKHRFSFHHDSYLIIWHGKRIFLSGDTENADTIGKIEDMDYAFIPYWILYDAHDRHIKIDAKMKALYHLYPDQKTEGEIPDDMVLMDKEGKMIEIPFE